MASILKDEGAPLNIWLLLAVCEVCVVVWSGCFSNGGLAQLLCVFVAQQ